MDLIPPRTQPASTSAGDRGLRDRSRSESLCLGPARSRAGELTLVSASPSMLRKELTSVSALSLALGADVPDWPPPLIHRTRTAEWLEKMLEAGPGTAGWWRYYVVGQLEARRTLVGVAGFHGPPRQGVVEIGFSLLEQYQRRGFGRAITASMINWAFAQPNVTAMRAETGTGNLGARALLCRLGFSEAGTGEDPDSVAYELRSDRWASRKHQ